MSIITVKTAIKTALESMQTLKAVYGYASANPEGKYPFATLTIESGSGRFASNAHNERHRFYNIDIFQEKSKQGQGSENTERIVEEILTELEEHFDKVTTLSGACKYAYPARWDANNVDREFDTRMLNITIEACEIVAAAN